MLLSFGLLFLVGLSMAYISQQIKLPRIIGMLFSGIILGPYVLNLLDNELLSISSHLREMALIIILIKAGLTLNINDLRKVGRPAFLMSFLPASFEVMAYFIFAPLILEISHTDALLMGAVLAAVSPAIVVPRMVNLIDKGYGTNKSIPQLILAGASCDDVFVIVLFTTFSAMALGQGIKVTDFMGIPISIILGVVIGASAGVLFSKFCEYFQNRNSVKVIIILAIAFILAGIEDLIYLPYSGLLAIISMACAYKIKSLPIIISELSIKFGELWIVAEVILFVLVGTVMDINYMLYMGIPAVVMIFIGLCIRTIGVVLSLVGTEINSKERLFCILVYLPKATVQAAIGAIPLSMGISSGKIILSVSILSIIITAPLGAIAIDMSYKRLLEKVAHQS
ncbi:MAG: potassium transporter [Epulopiscium sp. Nuni2H_MBin003]|nr:MAG: potassium transporter [Epulopiscium sp. Nuni2H_MBin003]